MVILISGRIMKRKYILFISMALLLSGLSALLICCDLYFPPASFTSPFPDPTPVPTTWPAPTLVPTPTVPPDGNMIYNHDFSHGLDSWTVYIHEVEGTVATISEVAEEAVITITDGRDTGWYIQFIQKYLVIEQGKTYTFTFDAYSPEAPRDIYIEIAEDGYDNNDDGNDYTNYGGQTFTLTTSMPGVSYTYDIHMTHITDPEARLVFNLGADDNDVIIDNVMLVEVP
jgi:hypothetical protein